MATRSYNDNKAFLDLLLNCLVGFVFLFMVSFILVEPDANDAEIKTKAEYVITLTWPAGDQSDVDLWLEDPAGNLISFKQKEAGLTHLDRDDLGGSGDYFTLPDGRVVKYEYNQEIMTIRGFIPGEWNITVHMYNKKQKESTMATVRIDKLNPKVVTVLNKQIELKKHWQESVVVRFTMKADGSWIGVHERFVSVVHKHPELAKRMAGELAREQVMPPTPQTHEDDNSYSAPHSEDRGDI